MTISKSALFLEETPNWFSQFVAFISSVPYLYVSKSFKTFKRQLLNAIFTKLNTHLLTHL